MPETEDNGKVRISSSTEFEVLSALKGAGETYGLKLLDIINDSRKKSNFCNMRVGSLYRMLQKLEKEKYIAGEYRERATQGMLGNPRRKYYRLLAGGETAMSRTQAYFERLRRVQNNHENQPDWQSEIN